MSVLVEQDAPARYIEVHHGRPVQRPHLAGDRQAAVLALANFIGMQAPPPNGCGQDPFARIRHAVRSRTPDVDVIMYPDIIGVEYAGGHILGEDGAYELDNLSGRASYVVDIAPFEEGSDRAPLYRALHVDQYWIIDLDRRMFRWDYLNAGENTFQRELVWPFHLPTGRLPGCSLGLRRGLTVTVDDVLAGRWDKSLPAVRDLIDGLPRNHIWGGPPPRARMN